MTIATDLKTALRPTLGAAEETIHTAVPPIHLGGGADVLELRARPGGGVAYASAGAGPELLLCTRAPADWAPPFLSRLAAAARDRFDAGHTVPLGDPSAPFAALLFTHYPGLYPMTVGDRYVRFLLVVGIAAEELAACRSHGTPAVVAALSRAGVFPFSEPKRPAIALDLGPSPRDCPGLSRRASAGLNAVVDGMAQAVENARGDFTGAELAALAAIYPRLGSLVQRAELIKLVQDSKDASLRALRLQFVRDAVVAGDAIEVQDAEHYALASAISALGGGTFGPLWDDLPAALAAGRKLAL